MASFPASAHNSVPFFAAREVPGCFTADLTARQVERVDAPVQQIGQALEGENHHFLPSCTCEPLHAQCGNPKPDPNQGCKVSFTPEQLREAAEAGCLFCRAVYGGIQAAPPWDPSRKTPTPMFTSFELNSARWDTQDVGIMLFHLIDPLIMMYVDENLTNQSPCHMFRRRADLLSTTDAEVMVSYIRKYNQDCHDSHSCSRPQASYFRPTRLVQVGIQDERYIVKLVQGADAQNTGKYLALSHCWGMLEDMPSSAKTLTSTLDNNLINIPWESLTQTFRDAVAMTERLGYTHIWIDSLCIIQDNNADWETEAAMMGQVYANCDLMLSADGAANGAVGLFRAAQISSRPWKPDGVDGTILDAVRFAYRKSHRTFGQMVNMFASYDEWVHLCPLESRAWCYQERGLAPRIVHFGMDELHWDCKHSGHCQCGGRGDIPYTGDRTIMHLRRTAAAITREDKEVQWSITVSGYSGRSLTFWTDRLPALSGIAEEFLPRRQDGPTPPQGEAGAAPFDNIDLGRYLAGLWYHSLDRGLCWEVDFQPAVRISTAERYIAPSWSWMSVTGQVSFPPFPREFEPVAKVLGASCTPISEANPTGAISYGEVVLRAKVIPLSAFRGAVITKDWTKVYLHVECADPQDPAMRVCPGTLRPDAAPRLDGDLSGATFYAGSNYYLDDPDVHGKGLDPLDGGPYFGVHMAKTFIMVVQPAANGEKDTYERVGSIFTSGLGLDPSDKSAFFEGVEATVIKLV